ncbi:MAG: metallophosphatase [Candidatus Omnitrophota bacterium]
MTIKLKAQSALPAGRPAYPAVRQEKRKVTTKSFPAGNLIFFMRDPALWLKRWTGKTFLVLSFSFTFLVLNFAFPCFAEEITLLYTGETHSMLYPCSCPIESDGGVARRASRIKEIRAKNANTLVLDSGGFFASGLTDEYTQNTDLDKKRTRVNLKSLELMKYDALNLGDNEFNFGREFLQQAIKETKVNFVSSNLKLDNVLPYVIKELAGVKIGIIGVAPVSIAPKTGGLDIADPGTKVKQVVDELKSKSVDIIILLSQLGEDEDVRLIKNVPGIDVVIIGHSRLKESIFAKVNSTLILRPAWQGRRLGKAVLNIKDKKISDYRIDELRLSDKIIDDDDISLVLPRCFSESNCKKEKMIGTCQNPGEIRSQCLFTAAQKVRFLVISPKSCAVCDINPMVNFFKKKINGLEVREVPYPGKEADKLIREFDILSLPAYFLGKELEKEKEFENLKNNLELKNEFYQVLPQMSGMSYFLNREFVKGRLDLFFSLFDKDSFASLDSLKEFNPIVHFLAVEKEDKFEAPKGIAEVEEALRSVCVQKHFPEYFWDYISCRAKNSFTSWWDDCGLGKFDTAKIKACAQSDEGKNLLRENISLNKELMVMFGPTYLLNNREVFSSKGVPSKEDLRKIIKR